MPLKKTLMVWGPLVVREEGAFSSVVVISWSAIGLLSADDQEDQGK